MHSVFRTLLTCLFLTLAACGGESGSSAPPVTTPPPPPPPPAVDTIRPTVVSRNPDDGATVLPGLSTVTITFSEAVRAGGTLEIRSGSSTGALVPISTEVDGVQIVLTSATPFPNGDYHVLVANVADSAGNQLETPAAWSFSVRPAPDTTAPSLISRTPEPGSVAAPDVVIRITFDEALHLPPGLFELRSGSLNGPVVAAAMTGSVDNTMWRLNPDSPLPAGMQFFVRVGGAADESGNMRAEENWSFSTPTPGFSLVTPDLRNRNAQDQPLDARQLSLTLDSQGRPLLLFAQTSDPAVLGDAQVLRFTTAETPAIERLPLLNVGTGINEQTLRVDANDAPIVAWVQQESSVGCNNVFTPQLHVARFDAGTWTRLGGVLNEALCASPIEIAMVVDGAGDVVVASGELASGNTRVPRVRRFDGENWVDAGAGLALRTAGTSGVLVMALAVAPSTGQPVTAWTENNSGTLRTYVSRLNETGDTWSEVGGIAITHTGSGPDMDLGLAVASDDTPYLVVRQDDGLIVRRFVNDNWEQVGPLLRDAPGMQPREFSLALVADDPVIAFANGGSLVTSIARLDGGTSEWVISTVQANTDDLSELVHDAQNGNYWIAFRTDGFRSAPRLSRALAIP